MKCKHCGSNDTIKAGKHEKVKGVYQKWLCHKCRKRFIGRRKI